MDALTIAARAFGAGLQTHANVTMQKQKHQGMILREEFLDRLARDRQKDQNQFQIDRDNNIAANNMKLEAARHANKMTEINAHAAIKAPSVVKQPAPSKVAPAVTHPTMDDVQSITSEIQYLMDPFGGNPSAYDINDAAKKMKAKYPGAANYIENYMRGWFNYDPNSPIINLTQKDKDYADEVVEKFWPSDDSRGEAMREELYAVMAGGGDATAQMTILQKYHPGYAFPQTQSDIDNLPVGTAYFDPVTGRRAIKEAPTKNLSSGRDSDVPFYYGPWNLGNFNN